MHKHRIECDDVKDVRGQLERSCNMDKCTYNIYIRMGYVREKMPHTGSHIGLRCIKIIPLFFTQWYCASPCLTHDVQV